MFEGITDVAFVERSIRSLNEAADAVVLREVAVVQRTAVMNWQGADRRQFDERLGAFLSELRIVARTLRNAATELQDILRKQNIASQR